LDSCSEGEYKRREERKSHGQRWDPSENERQKKKKIRQKKSVQSHNTEVANMSIILGNYIDKFELHSGRNWKQILSGKFFLPFSPESFLFPRAI
jgi:hypothetical protein